MNMTVRGVMSALACVVSDQDKQRATSSAAPPTATCGLVGLTRETHRPLPTARPRCVPSVIPLGTPLTSGSSLIYPFSTGNGRLLCT